MDTTSIAVFHWPSLGLKTHLFFRRELHQHMTENPEVTTLEEDKVQEYLMIKGPLNNNNPREYATEMEVLCMSHFIGTEMSVNTELQTPQRGPPYN